MPARPDRSLWSEAFFDLRKWFYIGWHRVSVSTFSLTKVITLIIRAIVIFWPLGIAWRNGWEHSWLWLVLYLLCVFYIRRRDLSPANIQFQREGYVQRKGNLAAAILILDGKARSGAGLTEDEKQRVRKHALDAIVSYVRVCLSDPNETKIFANLLQEDGADLVILQRDSACRRDGVGSHYPKHEMLAWQAIESGTTVGYGDIRHAYPSTPHGKPYNSVLVIPLTQANAAGRTRVVGAVSIDSSEMFHFNTYENTLETSLLPYTQLLTATLS